MTDKLSTLSAWERDIQNELATVSKDLEALLSRRDHLQAKLDLVQVLRNLERGSEPSGEQVGARAYARQTTGERIAGAVSAVLDEAGRPMHVREIRTMLASRGVPLPGRGTDANLIVHLSRKPDVFVRTSRGTYGLTKWTRHSPRRPRSSSTKSMASSEQGGKRD